MALKNRDFQPDPSKPTDLDDDSQLTTPPPQGAPSTGGSLINTTDITALPPLPAPGSVHSTPSGSRREHGPVQPPNPTPATDATAPGFFHPQGPVNPEITASAVVVTIPSATGQSDTLPPSQSSGLSQGQIIAAILLPILGLLIVLVPVACIYTRRRRRLHHSSHLQSEREMKNLSPRATSGWLPMTPTVEHGVARRPVPTQTPTLTQIQEPDVIPRRSPTMNSAYYSGLEQSSTQYRPPTASPSFADDPPPPYVPRAAPTPAAPELTSSSSSPPASATQRQLQPASLSEANLVAHAARLGTEGPRSPFQDPEGDGISEISSMGEETSRETGMRRDGGRRRDLDEISVISAPESNGDGRRSVHGGGIEAHQTV